MAVMLAVITRCGSICTINCLRQGFLVIAYNQNRILLLVLPIMIRTKSVSVFLYRPLQVEVWMMQN